MKKRILLFISLLCIFIIAFSAVSCGDTKTSTTTTANVTTPPVSTTVGTTQSTDVSTTTPTPQSTTPATTPTVGQTTANQTNTGTQNSSTPTTTPSKPVTNNPTVTTTKKPVVTTVPKVTTTKKPIVTTVPVTTVPVTTIPEPPIGTSITVTYLINNEYAGSLVGDSVQTVSYGQGKTRIGLTTNLGYKFVGWSDGSTDETRRDCPRASVTYTAIFEYDAKELPIISLWTDSGNDITDKENYVTGKISVSNASDDEFNFEDLAMEIRGRGNYTWGSTFNSDPMYNKRPYRVKLSEKKNLLGQGNGKAKVWTLIANHCDQSLLRNQTVMNFARSLSGIVWEPSASSVEVFLNGQYIGVYMLAEQVQVNKNRINLSEDYESSAEIDFLIHMSGYSQYPSFSVGGKAYEIKNDLSVDYNLEQQQIRYIQSRISECWDAVQSGDKDTVLALMDIDSVIDTYIVHELFKNLDTGWDNFYMFSEVDGKLFFGPVWDFDQCAGNADEGVENYEGLRGSYTNVWYSAFLNHNWFKELVLARWDELYLSKIQTIPNYIITEAEAGYNSYCRNFEKWQIWGYKINRETAVIRAMTTYKEHYLYFAEWMRNRAVWLNNYYHSSEFIKEEVKLQLSGEGTKASPYLVTSAEDFYNFTQMLQTGETFSGKYFKQTANIDMTSISYYSGIGAPYVFAGVYDGAGHTINVKISSGTDTTLFPYLTGTVMNLVTTGTINNSGITGGIARSVRVGGLIVNCGSTINITSSGNTGGIVGSNQEGGGSVVGCWFAGTINTSAAFGPINVFYEGRTKGDFVNNYYLDSFADSSIIASAKIDTELAISKSSLATLHQTLNSNLSTTATVAGLSKSELTSWNVSNGIPTPVAK